ncbi:MAG: hypothetical protein WBO73_05260 [Gammaproteobacteria bacterium]|jgi:hypothetical protein
MKNLIQWREVVCGSLVLVMTGFVLCVGHAWAAENAPSPSSRTSDFESLRSLLETRGWHVERTADGSTLLYPLRADPQPGNQASQISPTPTDYQDLRSLLETRGWRIERTADGSTLLYPLKSNPQPGAHTPEVSLQDADFDELRNVLKARGWHVERTADGSTLLYPLQTQPQAGAGGRQQSQVTTDFESLRALLAARGWRTERSGDGSMWLYPLKTLAQSRGQATESIMFTMPSSAVMRLRDLLQTNHWKLVWVSDNAVYLEPPGARRRGTATQPYSAEQQRQVDFTAGVVLPVNTTREAWQISMNWLDAMGYTGLDVGDIRSINRWIYSAKIIDKAAPYESRNELVINKRNGRLMALF